MDNYLVELSSWIRAESRGCLFREAFLPVLQIASSGLRREQYHLLQQAGV